MQRSPLSSIRWISLVIAGVAVLGLSVFLLAQTPVVRAEGLLAPQVQEDGPTNAYCLSCHSIEGVTHDLPGGEALPSTIDPGIFGGSAHGQENISCVSCHSDITDYPHPENPGVESRRDYSLMYRDSCQGCHEEQYGEQMDSIHNEVFLAGNENAPMCSDCHDPHAQPPLGEEMNTQMRTSISETCANCHNGIFEEYISGVHGQSLLNGSEDVPTCVDCHGVHNIGEATSVEFRLSSVDVCADCHTDPAIMNKYGLSTKVLDTYIDDFHGKTVTLFEAEEPGQVPNTPVCFDCHGFHKITPINDPEEGLAVQENLQATCQKCHPDASTNFPTSWLGHYTPDRERYPLVFWVNLFYQFFVPGVLGVMALYVLTDVIRAARSRSKKGSPNADAGSEPTHTPKAEE